MAKTQKPATIDAETILQMTLNIFRDRVIGGKPMTNRDVEVLENSMRAYGKVCVRQAVLVKTSVGPNRDRHPGNVGNIGNHGNV